MFCETTLHFYAEAADVRLRMHYDLGEQPPQRGDQFGGFRQVRMRGGEIGKPVNVAQIAFDRGRMQRHDLGGVSHLGAPARDFRAFFLSALMRGTNVERSTSWVTASISRSSSRPISASRRLSLAA